MNITHRFQDIAQYGWSVFCLQGVPLFITHSFVNLNWKCEIWPQETVQWCKEYFDISSRLSVAYQWAKDRQTDRQSNSKCRASLHCSAKKNHYAPQPQANTPKARNYGLNATCWTLESAPVAANDYNWRCALWSMGHKPITYVSVHPALSCRVTAFIFTSCTWNPLYTGVFGRRLPVLPCVLHCSACRDLLSTSVLSLLLMQKFLPVGMLCIQTKCTYRPVGIRQGDLKRSSCNTAYFYKHDVNIHMIVD